MNLDIARQLPGKKSNTSLDLFKYFPLHLNIYDQAFVLRSEEKIEEKIFIKEENEVAVAFKLEGELRGSIVCLLNLGTRKLSQGEENYLYSLFTESMNILMGQFLTNLEDQLGILSSISAPRMYLSHDPLPTSLAYNTQFGIHTSSAMTLVARGLEFKSRIFIQANKKIQAQEV